MTRKKKLPKIRLSRKDTSYEELDRFFDTHDAADLLDQGIMEIDPDQSVEDLKRSRLDVSGVKTKVTTREIVDTIREGRERGYSE